MKFKHHATGKIIEVAPIETLDHEIVFCEELSKYFRIIRRKGHATTLMKTSYVLYEK